MIGDQADMARRMRLVLPRYWFGDVTPVLDAVLTGLGAGMAAVYSLIQFVIQQSRLTTAEGDFIDSFACDFFGTSLLRWQTEGDAAYKARVEQELLRARATRSALEDALLEMTGRLPRVFEPARTADTGGYAVGGLGYGVAGGWGNLQLPYQFFLTIFRPGETGIAMLAGYGTGGFQAYGNLSMQVVGLTDAELFAAVPPLLPAAVTAWCNISS